MSHDGDKPTHKSHRALRSVCSIYSISQCCLEGATMSVSFSDTVRERAFYGVGKTWYRIYTFICFDGSSSIFQTNGVSWH